MSSGSLENEDLDNVPLVRMEDVQPSRDRAIESRASSKDDNEVFETCIIDDIEYENECVVNDDEDSNIGSMVSLQSEDVYEDDSSNQELIIPEVLEEVETENDEDELEIFIDNDQQVNPIDEYVENPIEDELEEEDKVQTFGRNNLKRQTESFTVTSGGNGVGTGLDTGVQPPRVYKVNPKEYVIHASTKTTSQPHIEFEVPPTKVKRVNELVIAQPTESWPTLEILPGGVIKNTDKYDSDSYLYPDKVQETVTNTGEMTYACAKCSQTFKYLFCLVKHVKWHEDQTKILKDPKLGKLTALEKELVSIKRERNELDKYYKKQKIEILTRRSGSSYWKDAKSKEESSSNQYICLHSSKKKIVVADKNKRKTPKRLKS